MKVVFSLVLLALVAQSEGHVSHKRHQIPVKDAELVAPDAVENEIADVPDEVIFVEPEIKDAVGDEMELVDVKDPLVEEPVKDAEITEEEIIYEKDKDVENLQQVGNLKDPVTEDEPAEIEKRAGCWDGNSQCKDWADRGECKANPGWMLKNCKKSCGQCGPTCSNKNSNCNEYVSKGYCEHTHVEWMKINCCTGCKAAKAKKGGSKAKGSKAQGGGGGAGKKSGCLASANAYRAKHANTGALQWDPVLAAKAQRYAEKLMADGIRNGGNVWQILNHDPENKVGEGMGENLYYQDNWNTGDDTYYCKLADKSWYEEIKDYSFYTGRSKGGVITHFTQMVWRNSKKVGYGVAVRDSPRYKGNKLAIVVAKYTPKGNWGNPEEFKKNVG